MEITASCGDWHTLRRRLGLWEHPHIGKRLSACGGRPGAAWLADSSGSHRRKVAGHRQLGREHHSTCLSKSPKWPWWNHLSSTVEKVSVANTLH